MAETHQIRIDGVDLSIVVDEEMPDNVVMVVEAKPIRHVALWFAGLDKVFVVNGEPDDLMRLADEIIKARGFL